MVNVDSGKISLVETSDGSYTFYNSDVDQCYHSRSGAIEEALEKHVRPSDVLKLAKTQNKIVIGDLFFGLGYNSIVAVAEILKINPSCEIDVLAFENDYEILHQLKHLDLPEKYRDSQDMFISLIESEPSKTKSTNLFKLHTFKKDNVKLVLFVGDAKETIKTISPNLLDAVFFDPFSLSKMPELWTYDFFLVIWRKMKSKGVLTTYSCARLVRDNMRKANFLVEDGPVVGRRSPATIARKV